MDQQDKQAIIWTKTTCPLCVKAKELLRAKNITYEERNIQESYWTREDLLADIPKATTVPQIFINDEYIGGHSDLVAKFSS